MKVQAQFFLLNLKDFLQIQEDHTLHLKYPKQQTRYMYQNGMCQNVVQDLAMETN